MAIAPGSHFGPYEVIEQIGAGGMGEVYRATDTNLKRDVAVKVLPDSFATDADRLARFQREAEVLATLNHPNIAQIYGLEKTDDGTVIVMELIDGATLADRIAEGPIAPDEALSIARQIADALEAAHSRQIVHRDLKPENIKISPDGNIKVLDFGIAKAVDVNSISGGLSPVMTTPAVTQSGVILGTAAYMSPEQARGMPVDQRSDIWAFGCLLFEMLTGQTAFGAADVMLTLARVLDRDMDMSSMPGTVSPAVRHTIQLCLEKDPRKRIADIRDVRLALEGSFETPLAYADLDAAASTNAGRRWLIPAVAAAAALAAIGAWLLKPAPVSPPEILTRFSHELSEEIVLRNQGAAVLDIAPNGEYFVYNGSDGIHLRTMDAEDTRIVPGTNANLGAVTVSPDGAELAYFIFTEDAQLVKITVSGGAPVVLADNVGSGRGISWEADGTVLFGNTEGIWRVSENGGVPQQLVATEPGEEEIYGPQLLPGGEWLLFTLADQEDTTWNDTDIVIESIVTGERRVLRTGGTDARYVATGHITYVYENVLFASPFDLTSLALGDERVPLVQSIMTGIPRFGGSAFYAIADNGTLVYVPGVTSQGTDNPERSLVWVDPLGNTTPLPVRRDNYTTARLSPDGTKIALVVGSVFPVSDPAPDLYIFDLVTENLTQLTFDPAGDDGPVWSPDGNRIYFRSYRENGVGAVYTIPAEGGTAERLALSAVGENPLPWSITPDGDTLVLVDALTFDDVDVATLDLTALSAEGNERITLLFDNDTVMTEPQVSPNGTWIATNEGESNSDAFEISIRPFPGMRQQRRPVGTGTHPVFSIDGSELFYFDGSGISVAAIEYSPFRVSPPQTLLRGQYWYGIASPDGSLGRAWDVDAANDRFLMITLPNQTGEEGDERNRTRVNVALNWFNELNQRVPAP